MREARRATWGTGRSLAGAALLAGAAFALGVPAARACENGLPKVGYLGISDLQCNCSTNFALSEEGGGRVLTRRWVFRSEPVVGGVLREGPSAGKLREGDVITAVDGALITTREGSARFSHIAPGETISLRVRREGRELDVPITVGSICPEELTGPFGLRELIAPRAFEALRPPEAPQGPETPTPPEGSSEAPASPPTSGMPPPRMWIGELPAPRARGAMPRPSAGPEAFPRGWLGVGLTCQDCGGQLPDQSDAPVWTFATLPTISYVEPDGPAGRAGLRRGDQLTHIDGVSLLTEEGGRRFGAVRPGQTVRWTLVRDGSTRTIRVTASARPGDRAIKLDELRQGLRALRNVQGEQLERYMEALQGRIDAMDRSRMAAPRGRSERPLRYAGSLAGSDVEVRGLGNVVVDDSGDEIVITTPDATIHIRPSAKAGPRPAPKPTPPAKESR